MTTKIKIYDIIWQTEKAGPSPTGYRTEIYFAGCHKGLTDPCKGCCNPMIWDNSGIRELETTDVFEEIKRKNLPKYITIVGGEATDQLDALLELGELLKADGYHVILFTWHCIDWMKTMIPKRMLKYFDVIVTDPYIAEQHIADYGKNDGLHNVVGSANQHIWCNPGSDETIITAGRVKSLSLNSENTLKICCEGGEFYV